MIADTVLCILFLVAALGALYLVINLIRVGNHFSNVLDRLERAKLKAEAAGNLAEADQLGYVLILLKRGEEGETS